MSPLTATAKTIQTVIRYTENSKMPLQQLSILLYVAQFSEVPMSDLIRAAGVEQASVSRNVAILGQGLSPREKGYGLIEAYEDPEYRRRKLVKLTARGVALKKDLEALT